VRTLEEPLPVPTRLPLSPLTDKSYATAVLFTLTDTPALAVAEPSVTVYENWSAP
jgi:hypothetical protein